MHTQPWHAHVVSGEALKRFSEVVATVPQAAIAMHSDRVRQFLGLPDDRMIVCAMSFGYADNDHPANQFRTNRANVSDAVTMIAIHPGLGRSL